MNYRSSDIVLDGDFEVEITVPDGIAAELRLFDAANADVSSGQAALAVDASGIPKVWIKHLGVWTGF